METPRSESPKRPIGRRVSSPLDRDFLIAQYTLQVNDRNSSRVTGRAIFVALIVTFTLFGPHRILPAALLACLDLSLLFIWYLDDRRRFLQMRSTEEVILQSVYMQTTEDEAQDKYIRHRYAASASYLNLYLQLEPLVWSVMGLLAIALNIFPRAK
jgi:hypothetical protein